MFERFTDRARRVIVLAQEEARTLQHNYIGTEHLLLGLIREGEGVAAKALASKGVTLDDTRKQVEEMIGKGNASPNGHIPFTPHARQVLELSLREALQLGHSYIGTEHILLGLIHEGEGVGTQVLIKMDVNLGELRSATIDLIRGNSSDGKNDGKGELANAGGVQDRRNQTGSAILDQFGRNLTAEAAAGKLDPVIGRSNEIERVMVVLSRRTKNNPVLIGEPGVGKTAVVEGLAQKINAGDVPETLKGKQVYSLDLGSMVAGSRYRGDFEERLKKVLKEIKTRGDIVLFIDEIHTIVGAGSADGALGASDMLKPMLARGELQTIGATTTDEYRKYIEKDAALERRFQPIQVHEPTIAETIEILKGLRERYENHHHVTITDGALQAAAELSSRYIQDRHLPDKAIDLIDEAGARLRIRRLTAPPELKELDAKAAKLAEEKDQAIKDQDFEKAAELRDKQEKIESERKEKESAWREGESDVKMVVDEDVIAEVISQTTGIPVFKLTQAESKKLMGMESELHKRIIGQDEAVSALSRSIRRARVGLKDPKRPAGSFIFAGPTGVGKTELAKALAEFLFDDEDALIRVDMSEFSEKYAASRLFGAPPGYVGYEEGGELTEKVRRKPFSVVLFDEIEKAHPDIFNTLLQVLDDGHLTDGQGRKVDFKNTIIILTTNLGTRDIAKAANTGFNLGTNTESSYQRMKEQVSAELKQQFRPEFLNRLDDIIVFKQLTEPQVRQIVDLDVKQLNDRLFDRHMSLELTDAAKDLLAQKGFDPLLGARPLRRVIQRDIEDAISEKIPGNAYAKRPVGFMMECHETHRSFLHMPIRPAIRSAGRLWFRHFQAEPQPYRSMGASLLDGVQPLLLGGLLRLKLGLLLRIGLSGDLGVKFGELGVELLLEGGLTGVGFRIGLLPGGILNSLDLLVDSIKTAFDAVHVIARNVTDLVPFLLNGGQCLASLLGGLLILDRHQSLSLGQQFFLLGEIFLFGRANLLAIGLTGVEERVRRSTETCPQRVIITTARTTGLLPTIHQLVELAGGFHPSGGILDLLGFGDDGLLRGLGVAALLIAALGPLAAGAVERSAGGGETGPQGVGVGLVETDAIVLVILPLLEQRTELVRGGTPVGVVAQGIGQSLGLLHNRGTFGQRLGDGGLVGLAQLGLLGRSGLLQCFELGLERLNISDDGRLLDFGGKRLDGLVDLTVLHIAGLEPVGEQVELCRQIEIATGIQCQGLFLGSVRELSDLAFSLAFLHEHGAVIGDTAERFGGLDIGFGESGGGCRTLRSLLGEGRGARRMRLHGRWARDGRFAGLGCGRRCLLVGFSGVLGRGDILVGHGQLLT